MTEMSQLEETADRHARRVAMWQEAVSAGRRATGVWAAVRVDYCAGATYARAIGTDVRSWGAASASKGPSALSVLRHAAAAGSDSPPSPTGPPFTGSSRAGRVGPP
jgi:hypothetical protein